MPKYRKARLIKTQRAWNYQTRKSLQQENPTTTEHFDQEGVSQNVSLFNATDDSYPSSHVDLEPEPCEDDKQVLFIKKLGQKMTSMTREQAEGWLKLLAEYQHDFADLKIPKTRSQVFGGQRYFYLSV